MNGIVIITPENTVEVRRVGRSLELRDLQEIVGGYIETAGTIFGSGTLVGDDTVMVVNEEGKILGLPENEMATGLHDVPWDPIVGTAVICGVDGTELVPLPLDVVDEITSRWLEVTPWDGE